MSPFKHNLYRAHLSNWWSTLCSKSCCNSTSGQTRSVVNNNYMPCHFIIAVQCGDPGKPTNGEQIVKKGYVYGGSVKFVCDKNYTLVGTDVIYCQANRSWNSLVPRCLGTPYRTGRNSGPLHKYICDRS